MRFWLGGYGPDGGGAAEGIGMLLAGAADEPSAGGALGFVGTVAAAESPSWVTPHPTLDVLYAALEQRGAVQAFRRTSETSFAPVGDVVPTGEASCHVAVSPGGRSLIVSCWGDGRVVRVALDETGRPTKPVAAPASVDPYGSEAAQAPAAGDIDLVAAARALREAAGEQYAHLVPTVPEASERDTGADGSERPSRAHHAVFLPGGLLATADLGHDLVRFWRTDGAGLRPLQQVVLPKGSGPRRMVWHPSGHLYVLTELSSEVFVLAAAVDGTWRVLSSGTVGAGILPGDTGAELVLSHDQEFLYAGVRGSNTLATLRVRGEGDRLEPVALVDAGVDWPRHHAVVRDILLVAGQRSDEVASLTLDTRTGVPGKIRKRTAAPAPTCIVPAR